MSVLRKQVRHLSFTAERFSQEVAENFRDVDGNLRQIPEVQFKRLTLDANFPLTVLTQVENPVGVTAVRVFEVADPGATVTWGSVFWYPDPSWDRDDGPQGLVIGDIDGLTAGTEYDVTLRIEGVP